MDILLKWICIFVCVSCVYGRCDILNCNVDTNALFQACGEYTKTMNCMADQYEKCVGTAGQSEITLSMRAMHTPSDCAFSIHGMANSMTAQSKMYSSMMKKAPQGLSPLTFPLANPFVAPTTGSGTGTGNAAPFPAGLMPPLGMMPPMMGDDMEMEGMEMGEGPMEMMEDMMEDGRMMMPGMGGMFMPGLFGGLGGLGGETGAGAEGAGGLPGGLMTSGKGKGVGAARFVDYRNDASGTCNMAGQTIGLTLLAILLSLLLTM